MAINNPDLTLQINANANQAKRELTATEQALDDLKDQAQQAYGALAAAVSTAGLSLWIASSLEAASNLELLARRSNATIEEFQRLAIGARMVGVEHENLAQILQDVNDKFGDFMQTDGGELADFFKGIAPQIGVTADQFKNLSGPQALQLFVSSLEQANTAQADMIFYLESIASDASLLLPMLRSNGAGFKQWADEAERLGLILSTETVRAISDYKAQTELTGIATENLGTKIGVELIPSLSSLNGLLLDLVTDQEAAKTASEVLGSALKLLTTTALIGTGGFQNLGTAIGGHRKGGGPPEMGDI